MVAQKFMAKVRIWISAKIVREPWMVSTGYSINYKYKGNFPEEIKNRLERAARMAYQLDEEMGQIRDDIQDAQALFDPVHRKLYDGVGNSDDTDEEYR